MRGWTRHSAQVKSYSLPSLSIDLALVEHAVQSVEPAVRPPGQRVGQLVRVGAAEAGEHDFAADLLAVLLAQEEQVGRVEHPDAAVADRDARGDVQPVGEDGDLVAPCRRRRCLRGSSRGRGPTPAGLRGYSTLSVIQMRPRSSKVIAIGIDDVRLAGDEFDAEALRHGHPPRPLPAASTAGSAAGPGGGG